MPAYVRYSDGVEQTQPREEETVKKILRLMGELRALAFEKHRHALRDAHAKSHGVLKGGLTVYGDLPEELAQGLFREPHTYPVILRYSTSPGDILPDGMPAFRGLAIKVIGVGGEKVLPEERDEVTQDFLLVNHPTIATGTVDKYLREVEQLSELAGQPNPIQKATALMTKAANAVANTVGQEIVGVIGQGKRETGILDQTYFSMAALRYGDYIAKINAVPLLPGMLAMRGEEFVIEDLAGLRDMVRDFYLRGGGEYEIRAQLCTDLETMPVEDGGIRWPEDESPYRGVAKITIPPQESYSPERRVFGDEMLTFNPWHSIPEHRPLGNIQRVRRAAYDESTAYRHAMNVRPRTEPRTIDELPD